MKSEAATPLRIVAKTRSLRRGVRRHPRRVRLPVPVQNAKVSTVDRLGPSVFAFLLVVSFFLHFGGGALTSWWAGDKRFHPPPPPSKIEVTVVEHQPPPPPPPPPPKEEPKPEQPKPVVHKAPPPPVKLPPPPENKPPPPPPNQPPPKVDEPPPPIIAGLSLSSTTSASGMTVNTGNTLYGAPSQTAVDPSQVKPYKAAEYAPAYEITENPVDLNNLTDDEMRKFYPPEALKDQLEAEVRAHLVIDDDGSVVKVVVTTKAGHGFDEAAMKLLKLKKFKPAKKNGRAVATEIPFTLHFELPY